MIVTVALSAITNAPTFGTGKGQWKRSVKGGKAIVERGNELLVSLFVTCDSLTPEGIF